MTRATTILLPSLPADAGADVRGSRAPWRSAGRTRYGLDPAATRP